jgi:hypothetical protein
LNLLLLLGLLSIGALFSGIFLMAVLFVFRGCRSLANGALSFSLTLCFGIGDRI